MKAGAASKAAAGVIRSRSPPCKWRANCLKP